MRRPVLFGLLLLSACTDSPGDDSKASGSPRAEAETIACALDGSLQFGPFCTVERSEKAGVETIVIRKASGGFHRLVVSKDGQHLEAADGADVTQSALKGDRFEVILGQDRYVIPARPEAAAASSSDEPTR